jgi:hypothetical protein
MLNFQIITWNRLLMITHFIRISSFICEYMQKDQRKVAYIWTKYCLGKTYHLKPSIKPAGLGRNRHTKLAMVAATQL